MLRASTDRTRVVLGQRAGKDRGHSEASSGVRPGRRTAYWAPEVRVTLTSRESARKEPLAKVAQEMKV
ncbi:hypothetical protein NDU88_005406 [Pleurodeles waltl]|uniref:Uncharacterized protein n=1 Tax=Pleurodeles waltl TaxID=8319 RepID=A0AAV7PIS3_PLEWA|nr:hypothetical protein NDU88_005406 [Pleurodeles waltl]